MVNVNEILKKHRLKQVRCRKLLNYYKAKHKILNGNQTDKKAENRLVNDYPGYITDVICGYFMGKPIRYTSKSQNDELVTRLSDVNESNNEQDHNYELAKNMSIYGEAWELLYVDEDSEIKFVALSPDEVVPEYKKNSFGKTLESAARIFYNKKNKEYIAKVEVYYSDHIEYYVNENGNMKLLDVQTHYFGKVPLIYYENNKELMGDFEKVISLIDEYDKRASNNANELDSNRNAYLKLKNMAGVENEDIQACNEMGAFKLDEDQDVEYLIKQVNDAYIQNNLTNTDNNIHKFSKVPNLSDESFAGNLSGVAIAFKLWPLEQVAATKERKFKTGLKRRLKLICVYLNTIGSTYEQFDYMDVNTTFIRNIPQNVQELVGIANDISNMVDKETALSIIPFIDNPAEVIAKKQKEDDEGLGYENFTDQ